MTEESPSPKKQKVDTKEVNNEIYFSLWLCRNARENIMLLQEENEDESDPGMIFIFSDPDDIHACLGVPAVAHLNPRLQQGKISRIMYKSVEMQVCLIKVPMLQQVLEICMTGWMQW